MESLVEVRLKRARAVELLMQGKYVLIVHDEPSDPLADRGLDPDREAPVIWLRDRALPSITKPHPALTPGPRAGEAAARAARR
jgi:hypothetical protein